MRLLTIICCLISIESYSQGFMNSPVQNSINWLTSKVKMNNSDTIIPKGFEFNQKMKNSLIYKDSLNNKLQLGFQKKVLESVMFTIGIENDSIVRKELNDNGFVVMFEEKKALKRTIMFEYNPTLMMQVKITIDKRTKQISCLIWNAQQYVQSILIEKK